MGEERRGEGRRGGAGGAAGSSPVLGADPRRGLREPSGPRPGWDGGDVSPCCFTRYWEERSLTAAGGAALCPCAAFGGSNVFLLPG